MNVRQRILNKATGGGFSKAIACNRCFYCKQKVGEFRDTLSEKEYIISGLCQTCQDEVFNQDAIQEI